jgi:hypothetical protein
MPMNVVTIQFSPLSAVFAATWSPGTSCRRRCCLQVGAASRVDAARHHGHAHNPHNAPVPHVVARAWRPVLRLLLRLQLRLRLLRRRGRQLRVLWLRVQVAQVGRVHPAARVVRVRRRVLRVRVRCVRRMRRMLLLLLLLLLRVRVVRMVRVRVRVHVRVRHAVRRSATHLRVAR